MQKNALWAAVRGHVRQTQAMMYVNLQIKRFLTSILLIFQYKYLKSCSGDFDCPESDPLLKTMRH